MKKLQLILITLSALVVSVVNTSCSSNDVTQPEPAPTEDKTVFEVSLQMSGEYVELSEEQMSRAGDTLRKKYYGINVEFAKDDANYSYSMYASGVFDNTSDMKINLLKGYKYKFYCTSVVESDDELWGSPFGVNGSFELNKFKVTNDYDFFLSEVTEGGLYVKRKNEGVYDDYPRLDRFYGELADFVPSEGAVANIPLKRTAFGIKVNVNNISDGSLTWKINGLYNDKTCSAGGIIEQSTIYTFSNVYDCWVNPGVYSEDFSISFIWNRSNGDEKSFSENISVKRNILTTLNIELKGGDNVGNHDITLGIDEEEVMNNEYIDLDI